MNKYTQNISNRPRHSRPKLRPTPVVVPSPAIIRTLLFDVLSHHVELLLFILLQVFLGLRVEEAYRVLSDPWKWIHGDTFCIPGGFGKLRCIRIPPVAWAWLLMVPGFADRTYTDFRVMRNGRPVSVVSMMHQVHRLLRAAGFDPAGSMPCECLRKVKISALFACRVPAELVAHEVGHADLATLLRHVDCQWNVEMGLDFYRIYPTDEPHGLSDWDLYHTWNQPNL